MPPPHGNKPSNTRKIQWALSLLWLVCIAASFLTYHWTASSGDGFVRGLNRIMGFLAWQALALIPAGVSWFRVSNNKHFHANERWLGRAPLLLSGIFWVGLISIITWLAYLP